METDVAALQTLPEADPEIGPWPCTVSALESDDGD